ncbi:hypothetical protein SAMN05877842_12012 [Ureibacillus acetophenoni]|uniref:Uncharacterized protein n=2 Tax=Ureibacillus acetophenoni TaxID=614649 RepID=A0A285UUM7_9BACL|nr:hypothetical protein SAMN05877842_12012 [Ureibacillus acetophenoni]
MEVKGKVALTGGESGIGTSLLLQKKRTAVKIKLRNSGEITVYYPGILMKNHCVSPIINLL